MIVLREVLQNQDKNIHIKKQKRLRIFMNYYRSCCIISDFSFSMFQCITSRISWRCTSLSLNVKTLLKHLHWPGKSNAQEDIWWPWLRRLEHLLARSHTFQLSKAMNHAEITHHTIGLEIPSSAMRTISGTQRKLGGKMSFLLCVHIWAEAAVAATS